MVLKGSDQEREEGLEKFKPFSRVRILVEEKKDKVAKQQNDQKEIEKIKINNKEMILNLIRKINNGTEN